MMAAMPDMHPVVVPAGRLRGTPQPFVKMDELLLRPWQATDAAGIIDAYSDPAIQHWHGRSMTHDEALSWVTSWSEQWNAETGVSWAVVENDTLLGRMGFNHIDLRAGLGEAAYWVLPAAGTRRRSARAARRHGLDVQGGRAPPDRASAFHPQRGVLRGCG